MAQLIFEPIGTKKTGVEWDLRDIDGATHFQGMAMNC